GAEGEKLAQSPDGLDVTEGGNADQPVGVEVVAEKDPRVTVVGAEEPGLAVVEEITLVNCLKPDGEALLRKRREDGLLLALGFGPKCGRPELAFPPGLDGDRLPERGPFTRQGAPWPHRRGAQPRAVRARSKRTRPRTGMGRDRRCARGGGGRAPRSA